MTEKETNPGGDPMPELYMICRVTKWENLVLESEIKIKIQPNEGQFGFCHVFDDYDKAVEFSGNESEIVPLKIKEELVG